MTRPRRPAAVEWDRTHRQLGDLDHGAPLLRQGRIQASTRDASFLASPDVYSIKARHIVVVTHTYAVAGGITTIGAACDPARIQLVDTMCRDATEVHPNGRCRRGGCRELFTRALQEAIMPTPDAPTAEAVKDMEMSLYELVPRNFSAEIEEAVLADQDGLATLAETCCGISGGDHASISVIFAETATVLDKHPDEVEAIVTHEQPAAALAIRVQARLDMLRAAVQQGHTYHGPA